MDEKTQETVRLLTDPGKVQDVKLPDGLSLRPYQERGFQWLLALDRLHMGGVLADDMGLGKTVQVIPHVTNEIQDFIKRGADFGTPDAVDVAIVEIGGTVGDIESLPFLEAVRQLSLRLGPNQAAFVHLTSVPWICLL